MTEKTNTGFLANRKWGKRLATAMGGRYTDGYTEMYFSDLQKGVEGADKLLDANLQAILAHREDLKAGKRVDVYLEWELTEDHRDYEDARVLRVEVGEDKPE